MKKYTSYLLLLLVALAAGNAHGQNSGISLKIVNTGGQPVPGATIRIQPAGTTLSSDSSGSFRLKDPAQVKLITISCIGYNRAELRPPYDPATPIRLRPQSGMLDEVIVQAYGTTTRRKNTGDITRISAAEISGQPVSNPLAALQGRVAGVEISQTNGVPGSSFNVQVHGRTVIDAGLSASDPLIVIDGAFFEPGNQPANLLRSASGNELGQGGLSPLSSINPADIESIEVLKDADATAIYGSRGANGVIIITTKKGKAGKTALSAAVYTGTSKTGSLIPLLNSRQYLAMRLEAFKNDSLKPSANPSSPGFAPDIRLWDTHRYTNFQQLLTGGTARTTDAQLSLSGGSELTQFLISGGYNRQTTVFPGDFADERASLHFNLNHTSENKKFSLQFAGGYSDDQNRLPSTDLAQYATLPPNLLLHNPDGSLAFSQDGISYATVNNIINPLAILLQTSKAELENLYSNLQFNYKLLRNLKAIVSLSYNNYKTSESTLFPETSIDPFVAAYTPASAAFANSALDSWLAEPQLNYTRDIGKGSLDVLLGGTWEEKRSTGTVIQASGYANDLLLNNPAAASLVTAGIEQSLYRYEAVFGRINYNWAGKYILNGTFRRDGSSRFGPDYQFADFGAIGAAWIFSDETFFRQSLPALSFGKLRVSYGITGNDQIGDYNYLSLYQDGESTYNGIPTLLPFKLFNPDYRWQTNKKLEAGIELGFFADRLFISADWFRDRSSNQLVNYTLPRQTGFSSVVANLPALVQNSGLELVVTSKNISKEHFQWTSALNLTVPQNKLLAFPGLAASSYKSRYVVGQPLSLINGFKYTGVDPATGVYTFEDVNKDGQLNALDYQVLGNLNPTFYGGLLNNLVLGQFQLSFLMEFKKQRGKNYLAQLYNSFPGIVANQPALVLGRWQKPGDRAALQKFTTGNNLAALIAANTQLNISDGIYGNASYARLKNLALAYNLPAALVKRLGLGAAKLFLNGQNLLTFSNYKGLDPETQDFYVLPPLRTIAAGLQFSLR